MSGFAHSIGCNWLLNKIFIILTIFLVILLIIFYIFELKSAFAIICYITLVPAGFYLSKITLYLLFDEVKYKDYGFLPAPLYEWMRFRDFLLRSRYKESINKNREEPNKTKNE